jgi:hypothetical protein
MRIVLASLPQMFVMAAIVTTAVLVPVAGLFALGAYLFFGVPLGVFITFGGNLSILQGVVAWWMLLLLPTLVYSAYVMPWGARD